MTDETETRDHNPLSTGGIGATIQHGDGRIQETEPGRIRATRSGEHVRVSITQWQPTFDETEVSISVRLTPMSAKALAEAVRERKRVSWTLAQASVYIEHGWIRHDRDSRYDDDDEEVRTTLQVNKKTGPELQLAYDGDDGGAVIETDMTGTLRRKFAETLEGAAERAEEYEPPTATSADEEKSRMLVFAEAAVRLGVPIAVVGVISVFVTSTLQGELMTINGEPVTMPTPMIIVGTFSLIALVVVLIGYATVIGPRTSGGAWRGSA